MIPVVHAQLGTGAPAKLSDLEQIFQSLIGAIVPLAGIILFITLVMGGFQYISSGGDPKKTAAAKSTLTFAVIGMVIVALGYLFIVVISEFTGAEGILRFDVYKDFL